MKRKSNLKFNEFEIPGWKCKCGEAYFESAQAERILLLNKLRKNFIKAKLGRIRSNLILRLPKDIEEALKLRKGEEVLMRIEDTGLKVIPA